MENTLPEEIQTNDWRDQLNWPLYPEPHVGFLKWFGRIIFRPLYEIECRGQENVPPEGGCILAPNHIGSFDPIVVSLYSPRHPFFMTKKELFRNFFVRLFIRHWGGFPVDRGQRDEWAVAQASRVLEAEQMLCMFPEGTRSRNQARLGKGKMGAARLALQHQVPLVPMAILGTNLIRPGRNRPLVTIQIGEPLDLVPLAGRPPYTLELLREMTTVLMRRIADMLPPEYRGFYA